MFRNSPKTFPLPIGFPILLYFTLCNTYLTTGHLFDVIFLDCWAYTQRILEHWFNGLMVYWFNGSLDFHMGKTIGLMV